MGLGALAAVLCLGMAKEVFTAASIGIIVYAISDKILRQIFIEKVEKPSVVTKTGIGIFIMAWVMLWIMLYTMLNPNPLPI